MSSSSSQRAANHDEMVAGYLALLRELGHDLFADHQNALFDWGVIYFDISGRIVEAEAPIPEEEEP